MAACGNATREGAPNARDIMGVTVYRLAMYRLLLGIAAASLIGAAPIGTVDVVPLGRTAEVPHPAIVFLWATWCVPCSRELPLALRMATAGAPLPMVTLALDPSEQAAARLESMKLPKDNAFAAPGDPKTVLEKLGGTPAMLPLALALNSKGEICGTRHGLLGIEQLHAWAKACSPQGD